MQRVATRFNLKEIPFWHPKEQRNPICGVSPLSQNNTNSKVLKWPTLTALRFLGEPKPWDLHFSMAMSGSTSSLRIHGLAQGVRWVISNFDKGTLSHALLEKGVGINGKWRFFKRKNSWCPLFQKSTFLNFCCEKLGFLPALGRCESFPLRPRQKCSSNRRFMVGSILATLKKNKKINRKDDKCLENKDLALLVL